MTPTVGMPATIALWSDSHAATVIEVSPNGKTIKVQRDKATRTDRNGLSETQSWVYERDPNGAITVATLRRDGFYRRQGQTSGGIVTLGTRVEYRDPGF